MKKITAILLMIFYLVPALGFSITTHFCGGDLLGVSLNVQDASKCSLCGSEKMSSDCCKTNTTVVKIKDTQSKDATLEISFIKNISKQLFSFSKEFYSIQSVLMINFNSFGSPPNILIDYKIYLLNRVFRI